MAVRLGGEEGVGGVALRRAVFVYGFAKRDRANIDSAELQQFKDAARHVLALSEAEVEELIAHGDFFEVR